MIDDRRQISLLAGGGVEVAAAADLAGYTHDRRRIRGVHLSLALSLPLDLDYFGSELGKDVQIRLKRTKERPSLVS